MPTGDHFKIDVWNARRPMASDAAAEMSGIRHVPPTALHASYIISAEGAMTAAWHLTSKSDVRLYVGNEVRTGAEVTC